MIKEKCQFLTCIQRATVHVFRVVGRRVDAEVHFCARHAASHFENGYEYYCSTSRTGIGIPQTFGNGTAFDIDYLHCDELLYEDGYYSVQLIEIGGNRRVGFQVDVFGFSAIGMEITRTFMPRPTTHQSMISAISCLGGHLRYVEIDDYRSATQTYKAKLHIRQLNSDLVVDLRPSDALVLALACDVPIIVSEDVLGVLSKNTLQSFLENLRSSQLIDGDQLSKVLLDFDMRTGKHPNAVRHLAELKAFLVETEILTSWQVDNLAAGKHNGFVLGDYILLEYVGESEQSVSYAARNRRTGEPVVLEVETPSSNSAHVNYVVKARR